MNSNPLFQKRKSRWVFLSVLAVVMGLGAIFRGPLLDWFGFASPDAVNSVRAPTNTTGPGPGALSHAGLEALRGAFEAYDKVRAALAADRLDSLPNDLASLNAQLELAGRSESASSSRPALEQVLSEARSAVNGMKDATSLEAARAGFAALSKALVAIAAQDSRLEQGWEIFSCPMVDGYNQWFQRGKQIENPYMGARMLSCGDALAWPVKDVADSSTTPASDALGHNHSGDEIAYYTCPMHPSVRQPSPGQCPICGMTLIPVTQAESSSGAVIVDEPRQLRMGIKTAAVERRTVGESIRAVGALSWDEREEVDVTVRVQGWIEDLKVNVSGQPVKVGQTLFTLYSPELYATQKELLQLSRRANEGGAAADAQLSLVRAARDRLRLWGLSEVQIDGMLAQGKAIERLEIRAPASGFVVEKDVVQGAQVAPGMRLFRIAPLDPIWLEARVYEQDLDQVQVGQRGQVSIGALPGQVWEARVSQILPWLDPVTRTATVRMELPNPQGKLLEGMYAEVLLETQRRSMLVVPEAAVVYTGPRRLVFVNEGEGRLRPVEVQIGKRINGQYEILAGLKEGDRVIASGNFMVASESRLRSDASIWHSSQDAQEVRGGQHAGH